MGGRIHGSALAREAAVRGRKVLLVDAQDFAAGTNSRSSRLIHGVMRNLREGNFGLVGEVLQERERLFCQSDRLDGNEYLVNVARVTGGERRKAPR